MNENLFSREQWVEYWSEVQVSNLDDLAFYKDDPIINYIEKYLPGNQFLNCFDIGCYPGKYLNYFGGKGYELKWFVAMIISNRVISDVGLNMWECPKNNLTQLQISFEISVSGKLKIING